ncbi:carbohydrate kinase family protein [Boseongicola aestuarii]|jgi:fructokinase|uniref:2-dehydro-3-deoxygluconokinase n=1 Tax=Boseongicola aestuarii TaxID=1470561 RepID=A0A238IYJ4_9RHOB|nr:carbohydrate kinase [Boseongicola aestuarii]SMX23476.1 2-dehydro-3-deoxygluconokinase [Boseongicola aestuarii]
MILCSGEALIDMLPRETGAGERAFAPFPGGAVFNTSIALGRLGVATGFFSGLSSDLFGDILTKSLSKAKVDSSMAARSSRPTTLAFVTLTNGQASYVFYDENTAGRMLGLDDLPTLSENVSTLFFGGISLMVEPCAQAYEALLLREQENRVIMIDPNIRQSFISDEATYRTRISRMMAASDLVKVSDEDLAWLTGCDDLQKGASDVLEAGTKVVCVTEGAEGVTAFSAMHTVRVPANKVDVVDTVGAGDTFNAGFMAALSDADVLTKDKIATLDEATIHAALTLGARAAAVTVSRAGANPPTRAEL